MYQLCLNASAKIDVKFERDPSVINMSNILTGHMKEYVGVPDGWQKWCNHCA